VNNISKSIDVLNLEWGSSPNRDRQMSTLVCNYLRLQGLTVVEGSIWKGAELMRCHRPKVLFMASAIGDKLNFETMRYAVKNGITGITLVAEGNFSPEPDSVDAFIWGSGNNSEQVLYESQQLMWSERTRQIFVDAYPEWASRLYVSGAVGFDIYQIQEKIDKTKFLTELGFSTFTKVVGVGCWDFGTSYAKDYRNEIALNRFGQAQCDRFKKDGKLFNSILRSVIEANPDILFLLKEHPGRQLGALASGIEGLESLPNTLIIHKEKHVIECIGASDIWLSYESTTAIEAWLLGVQTGLINPSGRDFSRASLHKGSPNFSNADSLQQAIRCYFQNCELPGFSTRVDHRAEIIEETIQWDDGLNHVRAGNMILQNLKNISDPESKLNFLSKFSLREKLRWGLSACPIHPRLKEYKTRSRAFAEDELFEFTERRYKEQVAFYKSLNLSKEQLLKFNCS